jgi:hypothetical protein
LVAALREVVQGKRLRAILKRAGAAPQVDEVAMTLDANRRANRRGTILLVALVMLGGLTGFVREGTLASDSAVALQPEAPKPRAAPPYMTVREVLSVRGLGTPGDLRFWDREGKKEIILAGSRKVVVLREDLTEDRRFDLQIPKGARTGYPRRIVDIDGDGTPEFVTGGDSVEIDEIAAFKSDGSLKWLRKVPLKTEGFGGVHWVMPVGKPSGRMRIWAGSVWGEPVYCLDSDGEIIEKQEWSKINVAEVIFDIDLDGDGCNEIVYGSGNTLECRRHTGELVFSVPMGKKGDWINGFTRAPLLGREKGRAGLLLDMYVRAEERQSERWVTLSAVAPFVEVVTEWREQGPIYEGRHEIRVVRYPEPIVVVPAILEAEQAQVRMTTGSDGVFLRLFDTKGWGIDGVPEWKRGGDNCFIYSSDTLTLPVRLAGAESDAVLAAHEDKLYLFEFPSVGEYPAGSKGEVRPGPTGRR